MKLLKKKKGMMAQIKTLLDAGAKCSILFNEYFEFLLKYGPTDQSYEKALRVHDAESRIDDIIRAIEKELYFYSLIPESRGDILGILEAYEKIPDTMEHICFDFSLQKIAIPESLKDQFQRLVGMNIDAVNKLNEVLIDLFYDRDVEKSVDIIDKMESRSDYAERDLMRNLFDLEIDTADKILLRDLIRQIGHISDKAQAATDRIALTVIKRRM